MEVQSRAPTFALRPEAVVQLYGLDVVQHQHLVQDVAAQVDGLDGQLERFSLPRVHGLEQGTWLVRQKQTSDWSDRNKQTTQKST